MNEHQATGAEPLTGEAFAQDLRQAVDRITQVLEREVPLLKALKSEAIEAMLDEKRAATEGYLALAERLRATPKLLDGLEPAARERLQSAAGRLASATEANARALRAGLEANGRLVKTIAQAVTEQSLGNNRYRADGRPRSSAPRGATPACSVNKVL